eukprot:1185141-Prorocentrum_minimum.AAC.1
MPAAMTPATDGSLTEASRLKSKYSIIQHRNRESSDVTHGAAPPRVIVRLLVAINKATERWGWVRVDGRHVSAGACRGEWRGGGETAGQEAERRRGEEGSVSCRRPEGLRGRRCPDSIACARLRGRGGSGGAGSGSGSRDGRSLPAMGAERWE